ncbi:MAG: radical SAM protein [Planctomycetaceae bacterium]
MHNTRSEIEIEHPPAPLGVTETTVANVLTRTTGYLQTVTSHSLQPYRGCTFGHALCGVGCYVQHSRHILKNRPWGSFLEVRTNAADSYRENFDREARWAARRGKSFSIFLSSATDPFVPQESHYGITRAVLTAMCEKPPEMLIVQTHSHRAAAYVDLFHELSSHCDLRVHVSIETDREHLPGLPPHASSVQKRMDACGQLRAAGIRTVVTVSPLLPIEQPERFFARIAEVADAVVIDHFIQGDGSADGSRTLRTPLPQAMRAVCPESVSLEYRDRMVELACRILPHRVGVSIDGFAGRYL